MEISEKKKRILSFLKETYPNTHSFLKYDTDWQLLFATILSAQATDKSVNEATKNLFSTFPTLNDYTEENLSQIISCIHKVGLAQSKARYLISSAKMLLEKYHGAVPKDRQEMMTLPGCGYKTSGVVLAELYDYPYIPVDTHVQRVSLRLGLVPSNSTPEETEKRLEKLFKGEHAIEIHRSLILFGRNICTAKNPKCDFCPFASFCKEYKNKEKERP